MPHAIGGAAGWVGGLGAFGGFAIPPAMALAVSDLGQPCYSIGFIVFVFLALLSLSLTWMIKYATAPADRSGVARPGAIDAAATGGLR